VGNSCRVLFACSTCAFLEQTDEGGPPFLGSRRSIAGTTPLTGERAQAALRGRPRGRLGTVGSGKGRVRGRPRRLGSTQGAGTTW